MLGWLSNEFSYEKKDERTRINVERARGSDAGPWVKCFINDAPAVYGKDLVGS